MVGRQLPQPVYLADEDGDYIGGAGATSIGVQGAAADDAAAVGNPVLVAGKYEATPNTVEDGDASTLKTDANGRLLVASAKSTTIDDIADVTLNNGSETSLVAVDTTRREAIIVADPANTVALRIGKTGQVAAARGVMLQPGQSISLTTTAAIYGYAGAAGQKVSITLLKD